MMNWLSKRLQYAWWYAKPWWILQPFSLVYHLILFCRQKLYQWKIFKVHELPVQVIVIGNIVVGGVGKTPLVIELTRLLQQWGRHPGIVSRGYGRRTKGVYEVKKEGNPLDYGDEPFLIKRRCGCPVFVGESRYLAGLALLEQYPQCDLIICDDGLQHVSLKANINIAVFDDRGIGNGALLPAGPLREPLSGLSRVNAIVINGKKKEPSFIVNNKMPVFHMQIKPDCFRQVANPECTLKLEYFKYKTVTALAGIGHPKRFFDTLTQLKIRYLSCVFDDHHRFIPEDLKNVVGTLLMTEKDAVKCRQFAQPNWWYLSVSANLPNAWREWSIMETRSFECLVCPVCKGKLIYNTAEQTLICRADRLAYPIIDGIPIMLESDAKKLEEGELDAG